MELIFNKTFFDELLYTKLFLICKIKQTTYKISFLFFSCLSPRSAYFYEFPPTDGRETSKKRTTLARLLRGLKTVNRRDRQANQNSGTSTQLRVSI